jgi:hypothetical protein
MNWLLIVTTLPSENATARMRAWRALKASGAAVLRDGVYLLPASASAAEILAKVEQDIVDSGGSAYVLDVHDAAGYPFAALFDRTGDYQKLAEELAAGERTFTDVPATDLARQLRKYRNAYEALVAIDFFPGEAQRQVGTRLEALEARLAPPIPASGKPSVYWLKLGFISFGGPAGQIAIMHQELVEKRRWISERASCTRSTTAWCCPARRRSNSPSTSAGCCIAPGAASSPARCSCCRRCSSWRR